MNLIRNIAFPFMPLYYVATAARNKLYDLGIKKSVSYDFPIICVGNLSVGGTGKTPMVEYLITLLKDNYRVATLSRGYKRKTTGFQLADETATAETLGDEPFQFYEKFKNEIIVAVDSDRNNGIKKLRSLKHKPDIVLLDDAFQHRKVRAGYNILLTTYNNPYYKDYVLPTGNLREPRTGAKRADIIVVTKCPENISDLEKENVIKKLKIDNHQQVFFSSIQYADKIVSAKNKIKLNSLGHFTLVTGIANSSPLVDFLLKNQLKFEHLNFKDHHNFSVSDIKDLETKGLIVTTEKDFMRLKQYASLRDNLYYLPIEVALSDKAKFNTLINKFVES
ncbi:tetraacyldisaccharide 4'-kinase [Flavobacteriaceae bacterium XHP0103]|uniref:tetraacyldisaccharide 4'-kinase n=1 Tax=Marixanthotalea marina TaxID=2844359 RepID=UPI002989CE02|nr:tetraacyldisaccharide 4'-kinase [Marixanthotalea marina]MBU3821900.1 tetraacyldisaccharide 4'-kinase [Marixanthotalea marina]